MVRAQTLLVRLLLIASVAGLVVLAGCSSSAEKGELYTCPMHPQVTSDKPGDCPICGMRLVPAKKLAPEGAPKVTYICPMHPEVTSDKLGDCPICGMHLVEKKAEPATVGEAPTPSKKTMYRSTMNPAEVSDKPGKDSRGMDMVPYEVEVPRAGGVPGHAPVSIREDQRRHMNLATALVERRRLTREVRTSARIVPAETSQHLVSAKVGGWVERLFVNATGQAVRRGQPMLTIYSPELLATQEEFLEALAASKRLSASPLPGVARGGQDLLDAARRRLTLWDVSEGQIRALEETGKAQRTVTLFAPVSGFLSEKKVLAGQKIMAGESLLTVSDLSVVWAEADIYESDLRFIKVGMRVALTLPYWPGKTFPGKISFLNPFLDPATRTLKARLEVPNPELFLKPEMYGEMTLSYELGEAEAVPVTAVMRTGKGTFAFLVRGKTDLVPTEVSLGQRSGDFYEVLSGLSAGDRVVTSANFLVDSESSLKAALRAVAGQ